MNKHPFFKSLIVALVALFAVGCSSKPATEVGTKIDALDASAWDASKWISAVDAKLLTGRPEGDRAVDGVSWFVSTVKNDQRVVSAKWMTSALGVYDIYLNGTLVGEEYDARG